MLTKSLSKTEQRRLGRLARRGDPDAIKRLTVQIYPCCFKLTYKYYKYLNEDAGQAFVLHVMEHLHRWRVKWTLTTFVYQLARGFFYRYNCKDRVIAIPSTICSDELRIKASAKVCHLPETWNIEYNDPDYQESIADYYPYLEPLEVQFLELKLTGATMDQIGNLLLGGMSREGVRQRQICLFHKIRQLEQLGVRRHGN